MLRQLDLILKGGRVERFHTLACIKRENVAEHSFLVAWVCYLLTAPVTARLLLAALAHDLPEHILGDMPSPSKKRLGVGSQFRKEEASIFQAADMPDFESELDAAETEVLKFADNFAGYLKCVYEASLGNRALGLAAGRYRAYLTQIVSTAQYLDADHCATLMHLVEGESDVG